MERIGLRLLSFAIIHLAVVFEAAGTAPADVDADLTEFVRLAPKCTQTVQNCFPTTLYVTRNSEGFAQTPTWFADQLTAAQTHFAAIGVGFQLTRVVQLPADVVADGVVQSREDRDHLGRGSRYTRGMIHVFLVHGLHDVDQDGVIRGVHWRFREDTTRRWVIISKIAPWLVLAHELGHFFGLPHSTDPASLMNKKPRVIPLPIEWTFTAKEQKIMRKHTRSMLRSGFLRSVER